MQKLQALNKCYTFVGGSLNVGQASPGQLANFNMWKKEMTLDQLNSGTCGGQGDVVSWNTLQEKGSSVRTQEYFPTCTGKISSCVSLLCIGKKRIYSNFAEGSNFPLLQF